MAQENITITLPKSGMIAVIKSYVPHKVARKIQEAIIGDKEVDMQAGTVDGSIELKGKNLIAMTDLLAKGLTIQIGDNYAIGGQIEQVLDDLDEDDFKAIADKATEVYMDYAEAVSPKKSQAGNQDTPAN